jgi:hypothetical protein
MKKTLFLLTIFFAVAACNSETSEHNSNDGVGKTNPSAIDTTQHATGITNQNVISTDTAAMKANNASANQKDSNKKK